MNLQTALILIMKLLDVLVASLNLAPHVMRRYQVRRGIVDRMIAENREPTIEEWKMLDLELEEITERIEKS